MTVGKKNKIKVALRRCPEKDGKGRRVEPLSLYRFTKDSTIPLTALAAAKVRLQRVLWSTLLEVREDLMQRRISRKKSLTNTDLRLMGSPSVPDNVWDQLPKAEEDKLKGHQ